jgi:hypothetical protein
MDMPPISADASDKRHIYVGITESRWFKWVSSYLIDYQFCGWASQVRVHFPKKLSCGVTQQIITITITIQKHLLANQPQEPHLQNPGMHQKEYVKASVAVSHI